VEPPKTIPVPFLSRASEVIAAGVSGSVIVRVTVAYAAEYGCELPHAVYPFEARNKHTALLENLRALPPAIQYQAISELCDRAAASDTTGNIAELKLVLASRYAHLAAGGSEDAWTGPLTVETRHWLESYPETKKLYVAALHKHRAGAYQRNALDDLRLALERLVANILGNSKSLENQVATIGQFIKSKGGSKELANMFEKLIDYYTKYQNTYVKHDDAVPNEEVEVLLELTSSFMKHFIRMAARK
jgi:hypothetical protein